MFEVGQMVVCIDDTYSKRKDDGKIRRPIKGQVYTIRDFVDPCTDAVGILLEEIVNPLGKYKVSNGAIVHAEPAFMSWRFRPVKKTSIDCFTSLLNKTPELEDA